MHVARLIALTAATTALVAARGDVAERIVFDLATLNAIAPNGGLIADGNGALYGTESDGGAHGDGVLYKVAPSSSGYSLSYLYAFTGGRSGGKSPLSGPLIAANGTLYGTTADGGAVRCPSRTPCGLVYALTPSSGGYAFSVLYRFKGGTDGATPAASLIADASGTLYGTTQLGGGNAACPNGCGTVFALSLSSKGWMERVLYTFQGGTDGAFPTQALLIDRHGDLFGTTATGGTQGLGVAFELTRSSSGYTESVLHAFAGPPDGSQPSSALVEDRAGNLFGTTLFGGAGSCTLGGNPSGCGAVFELSGSGGSVSETVIYSFQGPPDGFYPYGLTVSGEKLYGTTYRGGVLMPCDFPGCGTAYELPPAQSGVYAETQLYDFGKTAAAAGPAGGLVMNRSAHSLIGVATAGMHYQHGALFELTL